MPGARAVRPRNLRCVGAEIVWLGHATVDVRMDGGGRFLTDPVLGRRCAHLHRHRGDAALDDGRIDALLVSHLHHDHLDLPSLRRLAKGTPVLVPRGGGRVVAKAGHEPVEVAVGDTVDIAGTRVTAVPADHDGRRFLSRATATPIGYLLERDGTVVYFPGDTDLHPVMADLPAPDVALLPIGGWWRHLGPGHMDAGRAARAAQMLRAKAVLPIHWGTFAPIGTGRTTDAWFDEPSGVLCEALPVEAPDTRLCLVLPGGERHRFE